MSDDLYVFDDARKSSGAISAVVTGIASAIAAVAITTAVAVPSQVPAETQQADAPAAEQAPVQAPTEDQSKAPQTQSGQSNAGSGKGTEVLYYNKSGVAQPKTKSKPKAKTTGSGSIAPVGNVTSPTYLSNPSYGNSSGPTSSGSGNASSPTAAGKKGQREGREGGD
jgi:hypothetical protein